ncbi:hypothetical protein LTR27_010938 [Elasticomyces elasticus]|nr:hypothetical protein LTR27_010938 [Elasticomyces elasticus]
MHPSTLSLVATALAVTRTGLAAVAPNGLSYVYPNVAYTDHSTSSLVTYMHKYFTAKTLRDLPTFASYFTPTDDDVYFDATVGLTVPQSGLAAALAMLLVGDNPNAKSYPTRIIGDTNSAVVLNLDTAGFFGPTESRAISAIDFKDGKIARYIDYWDGRLNPSISGRTPEDKFPETLGESSITAKRNPVISGVATKLYDALSTGDSAAAFALFTHDAVFEDRATRTRIEGQTGIQQYLQRVHQVAPYGIGSRLRHIVGDVQGGAYEWIGNAATGSPNGITALELDYQGKITALYTVWDSSRTSNETLGTLVGFNIVHAGFGLDHVDI